MNVMKNVYNLIVIQQIISSNNIFHIGLGKIITMICIRLLLVHI